MGVLSRFIVTRHRLGSGVRKGTGMARTKHGVAGWLLVVAALAVLAASFITDTTGSHLQLAPVFVGAAVAAAAVRTFVHRSGRRRI